MTLYQFLQLGEAEQAEAIWDGVFIDDREDEKPRILLYGYIHSILKQE